MTKQALIGKDPSAANQAGLGRIFLNRGNHATAIHGNRRNYVVNRHAPVLVGIAWSFAAHPGAKPRNARTDFYGRFWQEQMPPHANQANSALYANLANALFTTTYCKLLISRLGT